MSVLAQQYQDAILDAGTASDRLKELVRLLKDADPESELGKAARAVYPETDRELSDELSHISTLLCGNVEYLESELT